MASQNVNITFPTTKTIEDCRQAAYERWFALFGEDFFTLLSEKMVAGLPLKYVSPKFFETGAKSVNKLQELVTAVLYEVDPKWRAVVTVSWMTKTIVVTGNWS